MANHVSSLGQALNLRTGWRSLWRQQLHLLLNLSGLALGLAAALLILLFVRYELGFDQAQPHAETSYRLEQHFESLGQRFPVASPAMLGLLQNYDANIKVTRMTSAAPDVVVPSRGPQGLKLVQPLAVEANFTDFFQVQVLQGDLAAVLQSPQQIALSQQEAERLFGSASALGQQLQLGDKPYQVGAIFAPLSKQSHLPAGSLRRIADRELGNPLRINNVYLYLQLPATFDAAPMLQQLTTLLNQQAYDGRQMTELKLRKLTDIHLHSALSHEFKVNGSYGTVQICLGLAALLLLIAGINFVNMSIARAGQRAKEVGVRKALGASRGQLITQFLLESLLLVAMAGLLAAVLVELCLPWFSHLVDRELSLDYLGDFGLMLSAVVLVIGLLAGAYPAFFLSAFDAKKVLSGDFQRGQTAIWLRKMLLVLQGAISVGLLVSTWVLQQQLTLLQSMPTGYEREARLSISEIENPQLFWDNTHSLTNLLARQNGVQAVTLLDMGLTDTISQAQTLQVPGQPDLPPVRQLGAGYQVVAAAGFRLLAGRDFSADYADWYQADDTQAQAAVLITESLLHKAGLQNPQQAIGQVWMIPGEKVPFKVQVVGVIADLQIGSAVGAPEPLLVICGRSPMRTAQLLLKVDPAQALTLRPLLEQQVQQKLQKNELKSSWLADDFYSLYQSQRRQSQVVTLFALLAVGLTLAGLFGLSAFSTAQRSREVAMRKVLGASRLALVQLLANEYLRLMVLSILLATPLTYWLLGQWLAQFSAQVSQSPLAYLAAAALTLSLSWLTVASLAWQVTNRSPATVLRQL